jgi:hypothetical protein
MPASSLSSSASIRALAVVLSLSCAHGALAESQESPAAPAETAAARSPAESLEAGRPVEAIRISPIDSSSRTSLFGDPTGVPGRGQARVFSALTVGAGDSPTRPFAANTATRGALVEAGGEVGFGAGLSLAIQGAQGEAESGQRSAGAVVGLRYSLLARGAPTQVVVSAGYLRELAGHDGVWARALVGQDFGPARVQLSVHGERVFADGRDKIDLMVNAAASVRVDGPFRLGVEYVGQDLEETFSDEAEGGARHIVGPTASVGLLRERLTLVGGPALALGPEGARAMGRVAVGFAF